jgi:hypothetical protein
MPYLTENVFRPLYDRLFGDSTDIILHTQIEIEMDDTTVYLDTYREDGEPCIYVFTDEPTKQGLPVETIIISEHSSDKQAIREALTVVSSNELPDPYIVETAYEQLIQSYSDS